MQSRSVAVILAVVAVALVIAVAGCCLLRPMHNMGDEQPEAEAVQVEDT